MQIGDKFGQLTVTGFVRIENGLQSNGSIAYRTDALCSCECGTYNNTAQVSYLRRGKKTNCGCQTKNLQRAAAIKRGATYFKHGMIKSPEYSSWSGMMARCYTQSNSRYADWGGRGITVCAEWHDFRNFYRDMGKRPEGMSLDRINNDGPYEPANCRWADSKTQRQNQRQL